MTFLWPQLHSVGKNQKKKFVKRDETQEQRDAELKFIKKLNLLVCTHQRKSAAKRVFLNAYLLFNNADMTVITLYLLNTSPSTPRFHTMEGIPRLARWVSDGLHHVHPVT